MRHNRPEAWLEHQVDARSVRFAVSYLLRLVPLEPSADEARNRAAVLDSRITRSAS